MNPSTLPALIALLCALAGSAPAAASAAPVHAAEGLWAYTGLVTRDGRALPLSGLFLIRNGLFVQQSVFDAAPFETAGSMAHAGPCWAGGAGLRLRFDGATLGLPDGRRFSTLGPAHPGAALRVWENDPSSAPEQP